MKRAAVASVLLFGVGAWAAQPRVAAAEEGCRPLPDPADFRFILVGDSQTTTPDPTRLNAQMHRWPVRFVGELLTAGNPAVGHSVVNTAAGHPMLSYQWVDPDIGWQDGGPPDFFNSFSARWICAGDVEAVGWRVGWYRLNFGTTNLAPWREPWGRGVDLVARVAVRTSPHSVGAIETWPERGGVPNAANRRVHKLSRTWGVQILEQPIPASLNPTALDPGIGLYFPAGSVEQAGETLEVLGVAIVAAGTPEKAGGMFFVPNGRGGWATDDHLIRVSQNARRAMIRISGAEHLVVMLGHNSELGGVVNFETNVRQLLARWRQAFAAEGRPLRSTVLVAPWSYGDDLSQTYTAQVEQAVVSIAARASRTSVFSYYALYQGLPPPEVDPGRYTFDPWGGHPGSVSSARAFAEDLFCGLFPWYATDCWTPSKP